MPLVAWDGTMRRRLKRTPLSRPGAYQDRLSNRVARVAGYVLDQNGRRHAVAFIINHANAANGQAAQDALLRWIYEARR